MSALDVIDSVLGIGPGDPLDGLRRGREEARLRAQTSYDALFDPDVFTPLSAQERFAAAARVAEVSGSTALTRHYGERRDAQGPANGERLAAILSHVETVARAPSEASRDDLARLAQASLTPAAIVTLSQIVGFVAYQVRIEAALTLLGDRA